MPRVEARLRRPVPAFGTFTWSVLALTLAALGAGGAAFAQKAGRLPPGLPLWAWAGLGGLLGVLTWAYVYRGARLPESVPPLKLDGDDLTVPISIVSSKTEQLRLQQV